MNEPEIISRWESDRPVYGTWARFVKEYICSNLKESIRPQILDEFLKVQVIPRLKEVKSLVDKALFRQKDYANPYDDITDKVGLRFVVLLTSDIKKIEQVINGSPHWTCSKDRDYEEERNAKPLEFAYQSVHYIVRAKHDITAETISIPKYTPCEIQVRTLLQHAHCELTHDSIYKNKNTASTRTLRTVAKSMALIEAADDFFEIVMEDLGQATELERETLSICNRIYTEYVQLTPESQKSNILIIDAFYEKLGNDFNNSLTKLLKDKSYVIERVAERAENKHLYRQSAILLVYLMASMSPAATKERWPLTMEELRPIYLDLGLSMDDY